MNALGALPPTTSSNLCAGHRIVHASENVLAPPDDTRAFASSENELVELWFPSVLDHVFSIYFRHEVEPHTSGAKFSRCDPTFGSGFSLWIVDQAGRTKTLHTHTDLLHLYQSNPTTCNHLCRGLWQDVRSDRRAHKNTPTLVHTTNTPYTCHGRRVDEAPPCRGCRNTCS